jgi:hypothetical protein
LSFSGFTAQRKTAKYFHFEGEYETEIAFSPITEAENANRALPVVISGRVRVTATCYRDMLIVHFQRTGGFNPDNDTIVYD